jgi:hypothetical protein
MNYLRYIGFVILLALSCEVSANTIIAINDWDTIPASGLANWAAQGNPASAKVTEDTTDHNDFMKIDFSGGIDANPGDQWYETISTPSDDLFAGSWMPDYWIEFDFWADTTVPDTLQVRWGNDESGRTWGNTISVGGTGWSTLKSDDFSDYNNWNLGPPGKTQDDFLADLNSIDWIGVYIFRDGTDEEIYGIDDYKLMVPEPAEYLMLFAALGIAVLAIRRKNTGKDC